jgi:hypothetical protein
MKMGRRLRCSSVTYRFRYAPLLAPCRRPNLIATKAMLFMGQDTGRRPTIKSPVHSRTSRALVADPGSKEREIGIWRRAGQDKVSMLLINCPVLSRREVTSSLVNGFV